MKLSIIAASSLALLLPISGCVSPRVAPMQLAQPPTPIYVPEGATNGVWERIVEVLHEFHFTIAREDRREGVIETDYKPGASVFEPWHQDSIGSAQRWESTLQSFRRRVVITFAPVSDGGNFLNVRVEKQIENLDGPATNATGAATLQENQPLDRNIDRIVGQNRPSIWLPRGNDPALEQTIMARIRAALNR